MNELVLFITFFIVGAVVGSFLNVVVDRMVLGKDFVHGRSYCDFCGKYLRFYHLIPLVSYLFLRGRCFFCKGKLSIYYPLSEMLGGLLFIFALYISNFAEVISFYTLFRLVYLIIVFSFFLVIALSDLKSQVIPSKVVYAALLFVTISQIIYLVFWSFEYKRMLNNDYLGRYLLQSGFYSGAIISEVKKFFYNLICGIGISLFFYLLVVLTNGRGMGGGDVRLGLLLGVFNGFPNGIVAVFLAFVLGSIFSFFLIVFSRKSFKDVIPFGPFLIAGSMISLLYGDWVFVKYISFSF